MDTVDLSPSLFIKEVSKSITGYVNRLDQVRLETLEKTKYYFIFDEKNLKNFGICLIRQEFDSSLEVSRRF